MIDELPDGWTSARLSEIAKLLMGQSPPGSTYNKAQEGLPFFQGKADFGPKHPTPRIWCSKPGRVAEAGDVLISVRAPVGPTNVADQRCAIGRGLAAVRPLADVPTEWLLHVLALRRRELEEQGTGSTFTAINRDVLEAVEIPVAPVTEQRRIIAHIGALFTEVDSAREHLAKVPIILKRFRQSVLAAACSGRLTKNWRVSNADNDTGAALVRRIEDEQGRRTHKRVQQQDAVDDAVDSPDVELPPSWAWCQTARLCQPERALTYGVIKLGQAILGGVPTLRSSDVKSLFIDRRNIKHINPDIAAEYVRTLLRGGEIVVTVRGTLGGVAVIPSEMAGYNVSREVAVLPVEPLLDARFLAFAIAAFPSQDWLLERAKGVAYTGINIEDLRLLPLPLPPLQEQHEIVRRVEEFFDFADDIEKRVGRATARADKLTEAMLAKAFRGELVPPEAELARRENRDYESASVLLERIRAGKAQGDGESAEVTATPKARVSQRSIRQVHRPRPRRGMQAHRGDIKRRERDR